MASKTTGAKQNKVVPLFAAPDKKESEKKWSKEVMALGYCIFPAVLLQAQSRLGVSAQAMMVLLQLVEHWWKADSKVFPSKETIADRVGLGPKQVQRHIKALEDKKLVKRIDRYKPGRGRTTNEYDLSGLVNRLKQLEPEITKAKRIASEATKAGGVTASLAKMK